MARTTVRRLLCGPDPGPPPFALASRPHQNVMPTRILLLATTPRSGSTLLSRTLAEAADLGPCHEYLNVADIADHRQQWGAPRLTLRGQAGVVRRRLARQPRWWWSCRYSVPSMIEYRDRILRDGTTPSGWFSAKVHWPDLSTWQGSVWDVTTWGPPIAWVHVTRRDRLRQAVSLVRARQTGVWTSASVPKGEAHFDPQAIDECRGMLEAWDDQWSTLFARLGVQPVRVEYEDLDADLVGEAGRVLTRLGVEQAGQIAPPALDRQADEITEDWVQRFRAWVRATGAAE